ncbi:MAG: glycosyltransferase family 1 protein [Patescibacteria group bacterium]
MPTTLNITIDISPIVYKRGVSFYTTNLVSALLRQNDVKISAFGSSLRQQPMLRKFIEEHKKLSNSKVLPLPPSIWPTLWYQLSWPPIESIIEKTDVYHAWEELIPPASTVPIVATIHDLAILKFPETAHPSTLSKHQAAWKRLKQTDSHVIAVSHATKKDVIELLGFKPEKVHLVYEALPAEHQLSLSREEQDALLKKVNISKPFILFVGSLEPRKNVERLVEAWRPFQKEYDLVIAGKTQWGVEIDPETEGLHLLGGVGNKTLTTLFKNAKVFAYPSLYEGFGLPILEAFSYRTPVLTSQNSAMSEISGIAAKLIDPLEVESIRTGLEQLLNEDSSEREHRRQAMKLQLQLFNWDTTAEKTIKVYRRAVEERATI